ncbi:hypothetical protein [Nocardia wallacei]|uniref:hypothetical protein n=1 Tax=Nocardia wallacei TaxID=480035 RepID=UPI0024538140|nr:hypothetical protein [Nocardia wallacei]
MTRRTTEWVVTGICAVLTVIVVVTAAVLLARGPSADSALPPKVSGITSVAAPTTAPDPARSVYHLDHIANACDLVDVTPFTVYQPVEPATPAQHVETKGDEPTLTCRITLKDYHSVNLDVRDSVRDPRGSFDSGKQVFGNQTGPEEQTGTVPGLGAENYFTQRVSRNTFYADDVTVDYRLSVLDADLTVTMSVSVNGFNKGLTGDSVARPVQDQVRAVLSRLRR